MQLCIRFDEQTLKEYASRGSSLFFYIHWQHEEAAYPGQNWTDFGAVLLSWWIAAAVSLWYGCKVETLLFMDGPYTLKITREGTALKFHAKEFGPYECPIQQFIFILIEAANIVVDELKRLEIDQAAQASLLRGIDQLQKLTPH